MLRPDNGQCDVVEGPKESLTGGMIRPDLSIESGQFLVGLRQFSSYDVLKQGQQR